MAGLGLIAVMALIRMGTLSPEARPTLILAGAGALLIVAGALTASEMATRRARRLAVPPSREAREVQPPREPGQEQPRLDELAALILRGREELRDLTRRIAAGETSPPRNVGPPPAATADPVTRLAFELRIAQNEAWNAFIVSAGSQHWERPEHERRVEVFVNLSRRMQTLSHRALQCLDELENRVENPDLLKGLFRVDHLTARLRRQAESLAVVGGAAPRRRWSKPVSVYEVLRSAIAEVEQYHRVKVVPPVEGTLHGGAVADVIHLLAELIENATRFAPPRTEVFLRAETVAAGVAIEIEDRGLGIPREAQRRLNGLLSGMERADTDQLVSEGRIGLLVVSTLSRRHKVTVRLQTNIYGGTQAVVVLPDELIGSEVPGIGAHPAAPTMPAVPAADSPSGPYPGHSSSPSGTYPAHSSQVPSPQQGAAPWPAPSANDAGGPPESGPSESWSDRQAGTSIRPDRRPRPAAPPTSEESRPELPKRRAQANLVPELLDAPEQQDEDVEIPPNPVLMAAFREGMNSGGREENPTDGAGGD